MLVPLNSTTHVLSFDELLLIESCAVAAPVAVGPICFFCNDTATTEIYTLSLHAALPISAPEMAAEFTVTGDVPVDVSVSDCVVAVFTVTLPKLRLAALIVS